ncbi:MAG: hypothetical protein ACX94B_07535 [Henriciella sp.]|nr:hypothetical protein [Hyphomonadaceae bacterium]
MTARLVRHEQREATWTPCLIRVDHATIIRGLITNTSDSGAELRCKFQFETQQRIEVFAPNESLRRTAKIVREHGNQYGLEWMVAV